MYIRFQYFSYFFAQKLPKISYKVFHSHAPIFLFFDPWLLLQFLDKFSINFNLPQFSRVVKAVKQMKPQLSHWQKMSGISKLYDTIKE